jgi:hypothetical protein
MNFVRGKAFPVSFLEAIIDFWRSLASGQKLYRAKRRKRIMPVFSWLGCKEIVNRDT